MTSPSVHPDDPLSNAAEATAELPRIVAALSERTEKQSPPPRLRAALLAQIRAARRPNPDYLRRAEMIPWEPFGTAGMTRRVIEFDRATQRTVLMLRLEPGATIPEHEHLLNEEIFILDGDLISSTDELRSGDYQRAAAGTHHEPLTTRTGCTALLILTPKES